MITWNHRRAYLKRTYLHYVVNVIESLFTICKVKTNTILNSQFLIVLIHFSTCCIHIHYCNKLYIWRNVDVLFGSEVSSSIPSTCIFPTIPVFTFQYLVCGLRVQLLYPIQTIPALCFSPCIVLCCTLCTKELLYTQPTPKPSVRCTKLLSLILLTNMISNMKLYLLCLYMFVKLKCSVTWALAIAIL